MFDLGWSELLLIGIIALIVVGPNDLPKMFRTLGRFTAKARSLAREFQSAMNAAAEESGVKDVERDLRRSTSAKSMGLDKLDEAAKDFESWKPDLRRDRNVKVGKETEALAEARGAEVAERTRAAQSSQTAPGGGEESDATAPAAPAEGDGDEHR